MDTLSKLSGMQKFIIGLVVGLIVGGGGTYLGLTQGSWNSGTCGSGESAEDCAARLEATSKNQGDSSEKTNTSSNVGSDTAAMPNTSGATSPQGVSVGGTNALAVEDQKAGDSVDVTMATLSKPGWVVVHEDLNGVPGRVLGAHRYDPGIYLAKVELLRATVSGQKYYVMLHLDDGDKQFDLSKDAPILGEDGKAVVATFIAE